MTSCPRCGEASPPGALECRRCGVVFARYLARVARAPDEAPAVVTGTLVTAETTAPTSPPPPAGPARRLGARLWHVPEQVNAVNFWGRVAALGLVVILSVTMLGTSYERGDIMNSFLHRVDLVFHEAGHVLFAPFGRLMMFLGGSLTQCLVPLVFVGSFLRQRNPYAAALCLWWLGQNLLDLAPYVADARLMSLPLVGEWNEEMIDARAERHDWHNILATLGWLKRDVALARALAVAGWGIIALALGWAAGLLVRQYPRRADVLDE